MKENLKENGITLVSLVITVVVLFFLAGIIITTNTQDNGVLNIANDKKEETEKMTIEESIKLELAEDPPKSYSDLIDFLRDYGEIENEDIPDEAKLITTNGQYESYVKDIWNIDKQEIGISIGDYVEYSFDGNTYVVDANYSGTGNAQTITPTSESTLLWRIIDVNKQKGQIKIVPTTFNTYSITLTGVNGYNNAVKILNELCNTVYSNKDYNTSARNINIEDIEKICSNIQSIQGSTYRTERRYSSLVYPYILSKENDSSSQNEFFNGTQSESNKSLIQSYYAGDLTFANSIYKALMPKGSYWISSRAINNANNAEYYVRTLNVGDTASLSGAKLFDGQGQNGSDTYSVLPIVTLNNIEFYEGDGSESAPYKFIE